MKLENKQLIGLSIGHWTSSQNPDGVIMWSRPSSTGRGIFKKKFPDTVIMATPHLDEDNVVPVDVSYNSLGRCMSTEIRLKGDHGDMMKYLNGVAEIINILK